MPEKKENVEAAVRTIRLITRKKYLAEEKVRILLERLRGESSIAELCWREGSLTRIRHVLSPRQDRGIFDWSKEFLEAGKVRLVRDTEREADSRQVAGMRAVLEQVTCACGTVQASNWWRGCR